MIQILCFVLPWFLRRRILVAVFGFELSPTARIGFSIILAHTACLADGVRVGHFNYIGRLDRLDLGPQSVIGNFNWITGLSTREATRFYARKANRQSALVMGACSTITHQHYIDCTDKISIGSYSGLAGVRSQLITHGIEIIASRQTCAPISIGDYTMIGTGTLILKGVHISDKCVVSAGSVIPHLKAAPYSLIAGNPATVTRDLPCTARFFSRTGSVVY
jgi:acetyltransferase-like isoleucine patch superfamily enzyme